MARRCYWVFDTLEGCTGGVQLRFSEARLSDSITGDGWRVFTASSPVDLESVQNLRFPRDSILAEIRNDEARTFRRTASNSMLVPHGQNFTNRASESDYVVTSQSSALILELKASMRDLWLFVLTTNQEGTYKEK